MTLDTLKERLPDYAKDLKLNLSSLAAEPSLNERQRAGTFIATALASRNADVIAAVTNEFAPKLSVDALNAARAAASIMAMNNIYYRFTHLSSSPDYRQMPAKLRMNVIGKPGVEKVDFELWSLAVSAINGCGMCMEAHVHGVAKAGLTKQGAQSAIRIAAVINATAQAVASGSLEA